MEPALAQEPAEEGQREDIGQKRAKLDRVLSVAPHLLNPFAPKDFTPSSNYFEARNRSNYEVVWVNSNALAVFRRRDSAEGSAGQISVASYVFDGNGYSEQTGDTVFPLPALPEKPEQGQAHDRIYRRRIELHEEDVEAVRAEIRSIDNNAGTFFHTLVDVTEGSGPEHCDLLQRIEGNRLRAHVGGKSYDFLTSYKGMSVFDIFPFYSNVTCAVQELKNADLRQMDPIAHHILRLVLTSNLDKLLVVYAHEDTGWTQ